MNEVERTRSYLNKCKNKLVRKVKTSTVLSDDY